MFWIWNENGVDNMVMFWGLLLLFIPSQGLCVCISHAQPVRRHVKETEGTQPEQVTQTQGYSTPQNIMLSV